MQVRKSDVKNSILKAARNLFTINGFSKTSMRDIAEESGVGLSNMYNYFKNKDVLFAELVDYTKGVLDTIPLVYTKISNEYYNCCDIGTLLEKYVVECVDIFLLLLKDYRWQLDLLFLKSKGSLYEDFFDKFTDKCTVGFANFFECANKTSHFKAIDNFTMHIHTVWMLTFFREIVMHELSLKNAKIIIDNYIKSETAGLRKLVEN